MSATGELEKAYSKYSGDRTGAINQMYDAQKQSSLSQLETA